MATKTNAAKRDVVADLLGNSTSKPALVSKSNNAKAKAATKATKPKASAKAKANVTRGRFDDAAKIKIMKDYAVRVGSNRAKLFAIAKKSKTVADYKAAKAKANMGSGVGGFFKKLVSNGFVRLS